MNRRKFIRNAAVVAGATSLPSWYLEECLAQTTGKYSKSANEKLGVALIGCGDGEPGSAMQQPTTEKMVAVCDVDDAQLAKAKVKWPKAKAFKDFRKVMEQKNVDVVVCGTVDHWHTLISLAAMRAGKDVYCEKPLTLTIDEGKHLVKEEKKF